eukprot:TRINITY_DN13073_c0_g1_i2.p1 TRINITY_DN13073_c0_g1~~TRINITY_DN13073_c0_g1_i2.p1  ORF type:complete len:199 (-),score=31.41 TRINITY_DN13073_c0_g1_i2:37-633(-)
MVCPSRLALGAWYIAVLTLGCLPVLVGAEELEHVCEGAFISHMDVASAKVSMLQTAAEVHVNKTEQDPAFTCLGPACLCVDFELCSEFHLFRPCAEPNNGGCGEAPLTSCVFKDWSCPSDATGDLSVYDPNEIAKGFAAGEALDCEQPGCVCITKDICDVSVYYKQCGVFTSGGCAEEEVACLWRPFWNDGLCPLPAP